MTAPNSIWFEIIKWCWTAIFLPIFFWIRGFFVRKWIRKRRRKELIALLEGLPNESKAKLIQFHEQGSQTLRLIDGSQSLRLLVKKGILEWSSGGTYDAVDGNYTVTPDIWEVMDDWAIRERQRFIRKQIL